MAETLGFGARNTSDIIESTSGPERPNSYERHNAA